MGKTIWYFPLESVKSRYTKQLCEVWIPEGIKEKINKKDKFRIIKGESIEDDIKVGAVLDATGRGVYSLTQIKNFLLKIRKGEVKNNDVLYIQDFWTPGLEAIQYALDLYNIKLKVYSMLHAQSVDEYDFTYPMRYWMRNFELGIDKLHEYGGIFVGSSIHKEQLKNAGFVSPIHVVSLPFYPEEVKERIKDIKINTKNNIVFSSRLDKEKNPYFMLGVAKKFLEKYKDWTFTITSGGFFRSNVLDFIEEIKEYAKKEKRFILKENISKDDYYKELCESKIQLNTSYQDYVSWTVIESTYCGCDICYPNFRSFPEFINKDRLYNPFEIESALNILQRCISNSRTHYHIPNISNFGRLIECDIICNGSEIEVNIWSENLK